MKETQIAPVHGGGHALLQAGFVDGDLACPQCLDSTCIYVQPGYVMACGGQPSGSHHAQMSQPDDRNLQSALLVRCRLFDSFG